MEYYFQYPDLNSPTGDLLDAGPITDVAQAVERHGWHGIAFTEHPAPGARWLGAGGHQTLDPFIALAAAGAVTERIKLLTYLTVVPYRNPLLLAKTAASLDRVSNGRFVLGAGTGYLKGEFFALGADFDHRNEAIDEALEVLPLHWSGEPFSYEGRGFTAREVQARPTPVQQPIPIWLGGNSKITLRRIAERAQGWLPLLGPPEMANTVRTTFLADYDALAERIDLLRSYAGERFAELAIAVTYIDDDLLTTRPEVERHRDTFGRLAAIGATQLIIHSRTRPHPWAMEFAESFATEFLR